MEIDLYLVCETVCLTTSIYILRAASHLNDFKQ